MAILDYEIGGNEVKPDASESIANLPDNRSMIVEHLTSDEPIVPQAVQGLSSIEAVFDHFKPQLDLEFENEDGQPVKETLSFSNVSDFSVKGMTSQSDFLKELAQQKDFYGELEKQLRSNKVLQRVLDNPETKAAFIEALKKAKQEVE